MLIMAQCSARQNGNVHKYLWLRWERMWFWVKGCQCLLCVVLSWGGTEL